jgi:hypothetical protein
MNAHAATTLFIVIHPPAFVTHFLEIGGYFPPGC